MFCFFSLLFFIFSSNWIKVIFENSIFPQFFFIIVFSVLLFFLEEVKSRLKYLFLAFPLLVILLNIPAEKSVYNFSNLEIYTINQRRTYYKGSAIAKFFENKGTRFLFNYQKNFFEGLDLNYYFFGTHPRERIEVKEIKKFSFLLLPLFLYGLYELVRGKKYLGLSYFVFSLSMASFFRPIDTFSFLFFPFFVTTINVGFCKAFFKFLKSKAR